jgi:phage baseplate assembly protein W
MAWSEGGQNIRESIQVILLTNFRERVRLADFGGGLNTFLFEPECRDAARHRRADPSGPETLGASIAVESARVEEDPADREAAIATIQRKLVATQTRERITLGVRLTG